MRITAELAARAALAPQIRALIELHADTRETLTNGIAYFTARMQAVLLGHNRADVCAHVRIGILLVQDIASSIVRAGYAKVRRVFSRSPWRIFATATNSFGWLISNTPAPDLISAFFSSASAPASAAIAFR